MLDRMPEDGERRAWTRPRFEIGERKNRVRGHRGRIGETPPGNVKSEQVTDPRAVATRNPRGSARRLLPTFDSSLLSVDKREAGTHRN